MEVIYMTTLMGYLMIVVGILVIAGGYAYLYYDLKQQVQTYLEYCPSEEDEESEE
jgi:hypothetical protein